MGIFFEKEKSNDGRRKPRRWFLIAWIVFISFSFIMMIGMPILNKYNDNHQEEKQCTITRAKASTSTSGTAKSTTSSTRLIIETEDCGTVYTRKILTPSDKNYDELAAELNDYQGQQVTLLLDSIQLPNENGVLMGTGYKL